MRAIFKAGRLILVAENETEREAVAAFAGDAAGHVFLLEEGGDGGVALSDLGPRAEACRVPINVTSLSKDPLVAILGNLAPTPFTLDGQRYASVESFWQGLKFEGDADRQRLALLDGRRAKSEGSAANQPATFAYAGETIAAGTWRHWGLMERANRAKFEQNEEARAALLATGERPLEHVVRPDSKTIPGVIMARIWMRIRNDLRG